MSLEVIISTVIAAACSLAVLKWRQDKSDKDFERTTSDLWAVIKSLRENAHQHKAEFFEHVRESDATRLEIEKKFGQLSIALADTNGKFGTIIERLDQIDKKMDRLERNAE